MLEQERRRLDTCNLTMNERKRLEVYIESMDMLLYADINKWYQKNSFIGEAIATNVTSLLPYWLKHEEKTNHDVLKGVFGPAYDDYIALRREEVLSEYPNVILSSLILVFWADLEGLLVRHINNYRQLLRFDTTFELFQSKVGGISRILAYTRAMGIQVDPKLSSVMSLLAGLRNCISHNHFTVPPIPRYDALRSFINGRKDISLGELNRIELTEEFADFACNLIFSFLESLHVAAFAKIRFQHSLQSE